MGIWQRFTVLMFGVILCGLFFLILLSTDLSPQRMAVLLFGLIMCGLFMAMVADKFRNRPVAGFWCGFLLGPFAVLVLLIMRDERPAARARRAGRYSREP